MHRFLDIAFDISNVVIFCYPSYVYTPSEGFPRDDLSKILHGGQRMARIQNGIETLPKTGRVGCTNVTDDRQTVRRNCDGKYSNIT